MFSSLKRKKKKFHCGFHLFHQLRPTSDDRQHRTLNSASQTSIKMPVKPKVVLAYSGGLDTSVVLKWLSEKVRVYEFVWCFVFFFGGEGERGRVAVVTKSQTSPPPTTHQPRV